MNELHLQRALLQHYKASHYAKLRESNLIYLGLIINRRTHIREVILIGDARALQNIPIALSVSV